MDDLIQFEMKVLDARLHEWGLPAYGSELAAGIDLRACIDAPVAVAPQAPAVMVSSGVAILIRRPDVAAFIVPRSGLGARSGIILGQSIGTIDPDYSGPWIIPVINRNAPGTPPVTIKPGDRIAQAVFVPILRPRFKAVDDFSATTARGAGGFGSTG
ncbi:MAG: dUTP diphosphatase [Pseudomonadota bacterium]|nr:dUTP diphosphatase [Pseudomonadota bacterium]